MGRAGQFQRIDYRTLPHVRSVPDIPKAVERRYYKRAYHKGRLYRVGIDDAVVSSINGVRKNDNNHQQNADHSRQAEKAVKRLAASDKLRVNIKRKKENNDKTSYDSDRSDSFTSMMPFRYPVYIGLRLILFRFLAHFLGNHRPCQYISKKQSQRNPYGDKPEHKRKPGQADKSPSRFGGCPF